jgi:outer membrane protein TolC
VKMTEKPRWAWKPILIGMAFAAVPGLLPAQVSLATVVDLAQHNSMAVKLAGADEAKAHAALSETQYAYIPNLTLGSNVGTSIGFPTGQPSIASVSMQSLVLSYPQRMYVQAARAGLQAASLALKDARDQVALEASTAYIEFDTVDRELEATHQQEAFADRLVAIEKERAEAGVDPLSDLLQARLTAAELRLKRLHLETRAGTLAEQLASLTGLPSGSISPDRASIPEIPAIRADEPQRATAGIESAGMLARSKQLQARGDGLAGRRPQMAFGALYNLDSDELNNYSTYYKNFTPNNISVGVSIQIPIFDLGLHAKARESAAEALRATAEAEQARRQSEVQIATLTGSLRELDVQAEIAGLRQQIAEEQVRAVLTQLELGNGAGNGPGAPAQLSPKAEQLARIDERQRFEDALEAGLDLAKARLGLLRALGHMEDWLHELHAK